MAMNRLLLLLGALAVPSLSLAENATTPYRALCQFAELDFLDTVIVSGTKITFTVGSTNPEVKIDDLALYIDAKSGRIPLAIDAKGVMKLPISKELYKENPNVVANQPKGSMKMKVDISVKGKLNKPTVEKKDDRVKYSELFFAEKLKQTIKEDLTEIQKEHDLSSALKKPVVATLRATEEIESSSVTILARSGEIPVKAVQPGKFVIQFDRNLMKEDPWVRIDAKHKWSFRQKLGSGDSRE